jgi:hypothetical protein
MHLLMSIIDMRRFRLLLPMPSHSIGDILFLNVLENGYIWETGDTSYVLPPSIVESNTDFFEELSVHYEDGTPIYFITAEGGIISEPFQFIRHKELLKFGNIFDDKKTAELSSNIIKRVLSGESIVFSKEEIEEVYINILNGDISSVKTKLSDFI